MKIVAHTPLGVFESTDKEYNQEDYLNLCNLLSQVALMSYFSLDTDNGSIYLPKEMIQRSVFVIEK
jgi:hypothetical protein